MMLIGGILLLILVVLFSILYFLSPGSPKAFSDKNDMPLKNSISEKLLIEINGTRQGMFIKGENKDNPVILYLHGGLPDYFLTEKYPTRLEKNFVIVWWEQRGCGISSNSGSPDYKVTIDQLADDAVTLTNYLLTRFNRKKIYLMGHSGGTFIGVHVIDKAPELYEAYIGVAQMSNQRQSERIACRFMLGKYLELGNKKMVDVLQRTLDNNPADLPEEYVKIRDVAMHELGIGTMRNMRNLLTDLILPSLLFSEYTLREKYNLWAGKAHSGISQNWNEMVKTDLSKSKYSFKVPVYLFHGVYDYTCSYELAREYFKIIEAPVKGFYTFRNSAHSPLFEEPDKMNKILLKDVMNSLTDLADK